MAFELHTDESPRKGMRRLIRNQLEGALESISSSDEESADEQIHSVRKCFKRLRAVLRLVRHEIGEKAYKAEDLRFREASRPLSEIRDAKVLIDALEELAEKHREPEAEDAIEAAHELLIGQQCEVRAQILERDQALDATAEVIEEALANDWDDLKGRRRLLAKGVRDVYKAGRKAFKEAKSELSVESLHDWRKQVKYLRYQLEIFTPLRPKALGRLAEAANELGELLGRDHDLAVLRCKLSAPQDCKLPKMTPIKTLIDQERKALQAEALSKGELLYREPTKKFSSRVTTRRSMPSQTVK